MKRAFGLAPFLGPLDWSCDIILEDAPENRERADRLQGAANCVWYRADASPFGVRRRKESLIAAMEDTDVVFICGLGMRNLVRVNRVPNARAVVIDHVELESALPGSNWISRLKAGRLEQLALREYNYHVTASRFLFYHFLSRSLQLRLKRRFFHLNYGGEWKKPETAQGLGEVLRIGAGGGIILYMGGWYLSYGVLEIIRAFQIVRENHRECRLLFCGRGPAEGEMRKAVRVNGLENDIELLGYLPDAKVNLLLQQAAVHMAPMHDTLADWARCPSKIPTYAQAGGKVVTSAIGEVVEYLGASGFYYEAGDVESMAGAIGRALDDKTEPATDDNGHWGWECRAKALDRWLRTECS
jgi:glycosyltransferase involved in cell wall biosynthesis